MRIYVTNLGKYNEGQLVREWLKLPCTDSQLQALLDRIGIGVEYEEYFITDYENEFNIRIGEYESFTELNKIAQSINSLNDYEKKLLKAIIELESSDTSNILPILEKKDEYFLHYDISTNFELGHYYIHEVVGIDIKIFTEYFDYEAYGRDINLNSRGGFTSFG